MLLQCPQALKKLIKEGRLEITAGGWVMPDEACTHIYALVDQFIEGTIIFRYLLGAWRQLLYATFFYVVRPSGGSADIALSGGPPVQHLGSPTCIVPTSYVPRPLSLQFSDTLIYSYKCIYSAL